MKLLDIIQQGLVGKRVFVYKQQQYNDRSHRNGRPPYFFTYTIAKPCKVFSFETYEKVEVTIKRIEPNSAINWLKVWIDEGIELRDCIYSGTEIELVEKVS